MTDRVDWWAETHRAWLELTVAGIPWRSPDDTGGVAILTLPQRVKLLIADRDQARADVVASDAEIERLKADLATQIERNSPFTVSITGFVPEDILTSLRDKLDEQICRWGTDFAPYTDDLRIEFVGGLGDIIWRERKTANENEARISELEQKIEELQALATKRKMQREYHRGRRMAVERILTDDGRLDGAEVARLQELLTRVGVATASADVVEAVRRVEATRKHFGVQVYGDRSKLVGDSAGRLIETLRADLNRIADAIPDVFRGIRSLNGIRDIPAEVEALAGSHEDNNDLRKRLIVARDALRATVHGRLQPSRFQRWSMVVMFPGELEICGDFTATPDAIVAYGELFESLVAGSITFKRID
jgi:hypothetical protein